jgi:hypothetical protein
MPAGTAPTATLATGRCVRPSKASRRPPNQSATKTRCPSGDTAMPTAPCPAANVSTTSRRCRSITDTVCSPGLVTKALPAATLTAMPAGALPTFTVASTLASATSTTLTSCVPWLVIQASGAAMASSGSASRMAQMRNRT